MKVTVTRLTTEERIKILMPLRGYIVLGAMEPYPIGHVCCEISAGLHGPMPQPFYVLAETDKQDALEQTKILAEHGDDPTTYDWKYFYKLTTD